MVLKWSADETSGNLKWSSVTWLRSSQGAVDHSWRLAIPRVALHAKPNEQTGVEWLHAAKAVSFCFKLKSWKIQSQH